MNEVEAYRVFVDWGSEHWHRGVFLDGDYAPMDEAEHWVEELLSQALAAMADAGVEVSRGPLRVLDGKLFVEVDGVDLMVRDPVHDHASLSIEVVLGRLEAIAADRESGARWHFWYTGDPVGAAYFVTPEELITSAGIDVRELGTAEQWFRPDPALGAE